MNSTCRTGKIARLPHEIREKLNRRLQDGETARPILDWLNSRPAVKKILEDQFESRPVTPQNLSEWRRGGYRDWLVVQDNLAMVRSLADRQGLGCGELSESFTANLAHWTALQYASCAQTLVADETDPERRWERLRQLSIEVSRLRRAEAFSKRLDLERERLDLAKSKTNEAMEEKFRKWSKREDKRISRKRRRGLTKKEQKQIERAMGLYTAPNRYGASARERARLAQKVRETKIAGGLNPDAPEEPSRILPNQAPSDLIAPDSTKSTETEAAPQNASESQPAPEQPVVIQEWPVDSTCGPVFWSNGGGPRPPANKPAAQPSVQSASPSRQPFDVPPGLRPFYDVHYKTPF